jgi:hypothetical protein
MGEKKNGTTTGVDSVTTIEDKLNRIHMFVNGTYMGFGKNGKIVFYLEEEYKGMSPEEKKKIVKIEYYKDGSRERLNSVAEGSKLLRNEMGNNQIPKFLENNEKADEAYGLDWGVFSEFSSENEAMNKLYTHTGLVQDNAVEKTRKGARESALNKDFKNYSEVTSFPRLQLVHRDNSPKESNGENSNNSEEEAVHREKQAVLNMLADIEDNIASIEIFLPFLQRYVKDLNIEC